ncbi:MAG: undecaprenyl-diphosphate phosphatase [Betaproteobacteria bacterium]|nr:undecaprenyl-diphosphate phosphatase [Betaproteobacteria bacterium]
MDALWVVALILGALEGLTEFLPVSSTGHLIIAGHLLGWTDDTSKVFKIVIQLGAVLAVCWAYRRRLVHLLTHVRTDPVERRLAINLLIAFVPAAVLGVLLHHTIKALLFGPITVAAALVAGGVLILLIERRPQAPSVGSIDAIDARLALKLGLAQAAALFPGVSRSGATIVGGLWLGLSRTAAAEFSFFLAMPTMFAATAYDLLKSRELLHAADLPVFAVGFVTAFVTGLLAVRLFLAWVSRNSFAVFAWYRIGFGLVVLLSWQLGWVDWATSPS